MLPEIFTGLSAKKPLLLMIGAVAVSQDWIKDHWFEIVKLGFLVVGVVWGTVWGLNKTLDHHSQAILSLQKAQEIDIDDHKKFADTLSNINTSQKLMQYELKRQQKDIDKLDSTSEHILKELRK